MLGTGMVLAAAGRKKTVTQGANQRRTAFHVARDPVGFPFSGPDLRNLSGLCVAIL